MIEFALVAPIVFVLFFGSLEFCRMSMIGHTASNAVYEAARRGIAPGATATEVRREAQRILGTLGLRNTSIVVRPRRISDQTDEITVRVTVPVGRNSFVPGAQFFNQDLTRELTLRREGR